VQKPRGRLNADNDEGVRRGIENKRRRRAPVPYTPEDPAAKANKADKRKADYGRGAKRKVPLITLITSNNP